MLDLHVHPVILIRVQITVILICIRVIVVLLIGGIVLSLDVLTETISRGFTVRIVGREILVEMAVNF